MEEVDVCLEYRSTSEGISSAIVEISRLWVEWVKSQVKMKDRLR